MSKCTCTSLENFMGLRHSHRDGHTHTSSLAPSFPPFPPSLFETVFEGSSTGHLHFSPYRKWPSACPVPGRYSTHPAFFPSPPPSPSLLTCPSP